jgi:hypothetical protein
MRGRSEHYTRSTTEVQRFCRTEGKDTTWHVSHGKVQYCKSCDLNRRIAAHARKLRAARTARAPIGPGLFDK